MRAFQWLATMMIAIVMTTAVHAAVPAFTQTKEPPQITWHSWGDALFAKAKKEKRHVLLDLSARWCHWCHFMEARTYAHSNVRRLVAAGYLAVRVDQDANPDLASRYGDWGWPATIVLAPNGTQVLAIRGNKRPRNFIPILDELIEDPLKSWKDSRDIRAGRRKPVRKKRDAAATGPAEKSGR